MNRLKSLNTWAGSNHYVSRRTAQGYLNTSLLELNNSSSCGSSCGASDETEKPEPKPSACGSSCGATDK